LIHLTKNDYSLDTFFKILDKNENKELDYEELETGLFGRVDGLSKSDVRILFDAVDFDRSRQITIDELREELSTINAVILLT
jgi:Ca2+-binding EF-hand superfamily protein